MAHNKHVFGLFLYFNYTLSEWPSLNMDPGSNPNLQSPIVQKPISTNPELNF